MMSRVTGACVCGLALSASLSAHAQVADRYGPSAPDYDSAGTASGMALAGAPVRMLSWPGKASAVAGPAPVAVPVAAPTAAPPSPVAAPLARRAPPSLRQAPANDAPPQVRRASAALAPAAPRYGLVQAYPAPAPAQAEAPSIYDPPARAAISQVASSQPASVLPASVQPSSGQPSYGQPASNRAATTADAAHPGWAPPRHPWAEGKETSVRFYSLHRQYGVTPDPAPIPPQFFTATADLGDPAGPMTRTISGAGSAAQAARAVQAAQADTSSDPASSQP